MGGVLTRFVAPRDTKNSVLRVKWHQDGTLLVEDATPAVPAAYWTDTRTLGVTTSRNGRRPAQPASSTDAANGGVGADVTQEVEALCARVVHHVRDAARMEAVRL